MPQRNEGKERCSTKTKEKAIAIKKRIHDICPLQKRDKACSKIERKRFLLGHCVEKKRLIVITCL